MRYRSVFSFAFATFFSRIAGFIREGVVAYLLGASGIADAFYAALRVPALLRDLLAENAVQNAFIPSMVEAREKGDRPDVFLGTTLFLWLSVAFIVSLLGVIAAPLVVKIIAYGFTEQPQKYLIAVKLVKITSFYLLLVTVSALASGLLNTIKSFFVPAVSPVLFNTGIIICGLLSTKLTDQPAGFAIAMAIGVIFGGILQVAFLLPFLKKASFPISFKLDLHHRSLKKLTKLLLPVAFSTGFSRLTLFVNTFVASFLQNGSIALLNYAFRIMNLPLGLFGVGISTVALPELSEYAAHEADPSDIVARSFNLVFLLALPATIFMMLDADSIISFLFERGSFSRVDTYMSAMPLVLYSLLVVPASLSKILLAVYFSHGSVRRPNVAFGVGAATNILMAVTLPFKMGYSGLALATGLSSWVQLLLLWHGGSRFFQFRRAHISVFWRLLMVNVLSAIAMLGSMAHPLLTIKFRWIQDFVVFGVAYVVLNLIFVPELRRQVMGMVRK